ncbi:hypothetical protein VKT23_011654 [Stygiomarasmius scandens]|uniref:Uncharacterized protein n=1 Tax=Marasmiellus scandens TaxID=2682957 RepID=A0ABR1JD84_9AGAR
MCSLSAFLLLSKLVYAFSVSSLPSSVGVNQPFTVSWDRNDNDPKDWHFVKKAKIPHAPLKTLTIEVVDADKPNGQVDTLFTPGLFIISAISPDPPFSSFSAGDPVKIPLQNGVDPNDNGNNEVTGNGEKVGNNDDGNGNGRGDSNPANNQTGLGGPSDNPPGLAPPGPPVGTGAPAMGPIISFPQVTSTSLTSSSEGSPGSNAKSSSISGPDDTTATLTATPQKKSSPPGTVASSSGSRSETTLSTTQSATNQPPQQNNNSVSHSRLAIIAASIIGAAAFISLLLCYFLYNRRRKRLNERTNHLTDTFSFNRDMEQRREDAFRGINRNVNGDGLGAGGVFIIPGISVLTNSNVNTQRQRGDLNGRLRSLRSWTSSVSRTFTFTTISSGSVFNGSGSINSNGDN